MKKILSVLLLVVLLLTCFVACSSNDEKNFYNDSLTESTNAPSSTDFLVGRWSSLSEVGHTIENSFGYENVEFYITVEYCFNKDNTFTFKVTDVDEDKLRQIVMANRENSPIETINAGVESIKNALYFQTDKGTYEFDGDKFILNTKLNTLTFNLEVIDDENIVLTHNQKSSELTKIGTP